MMDRRGLTFTAVFFAGAVFSLCVSLILLGADADAIRDGATARVEDRTEVPLLRNAITAAIGDELRSRQGRNLVLTAGAAAAVAFGIAIGGSRYSGGTRE